MRTLDFILADESQLEEVYQVFVAAIEEMNRNNISQWDEQYPDKEILQSDIQKQELYIGKVDEEIAAVYVLNQECDEQYSNGKWQYPDATFQVIHRLCVNPKFQNQGIGTKTMEHIEKQVSEKGIHAIRLDAFTLNPFALKMYEKLGYVKVGDVHWRKGKFYLMEKKL